MFIAMDPPKHDLQRKTVSGVVAPPNLAKLEGTIRERAGRILDSLPRDETFNWVDKVSIELTTQMLATLFDFPFEDRRKLTYWSDVITADDTDAASFGSEDERQAELLECLEYFTRAVERAREHTGGNDLISMLAHGESTRNMPPMEYLGNLILLIVGGNDTTRNSISGGVVALNQNPDEYDEAAQRSLADSQHGLGDHPLADAARAHAPHRALVDTELRGKKIKKGDKVVMWYVSGNRDETAIPTSRGVHHRPAEGAPASVVRFRHSPLHGQPARRDATARGVGRDHEALHHVEVVGEPMRVRSNFVKGYSNLPVRVHRV